MLVSLSDADSSKEWLEYDEKSLLLKTKSDLSRQTLGTFQVTILLTDYQDQKTNYSLLIEVSCP